jgi:small ligand-binding sensory domain FIST
MWDIVPLFFGRKLPERLHEEYGNTHQFFGSLAWDEDNSPILPVVCEENSKLYIGVRDEERMFADLEKMVEQLVNRCQGRQLYAVFHADCAARGRWTLDRVLKDEIIHKMQYPLIKDTTAPWLGLYGFGEFARLGNRNRFHMYTTSLFIILKKEK